MNQRDIEQAITTLETRRHTLEPTVVDTTLAALRYQLDHLTDAAAITPSALRGERKQVTVMFADISGFTAMSEKLDPEEVRSMINACFERLGAVIDRYDGHIDKFIGDEIMALFGAPVAHENDPERALRAALDMEIALGEFNQEHAAQIPKPLALHFGINSGLVIAGGIGTPQRQDYSVMGDTVNLAARLEGLSEAGEILVGENTHRLTAPLFEFEALPPVSVKGKAQPVQVYRLLRARAITGGQIRGIEGLYSPLVGRVAEMQLLESTLKNLYAGQGRLISVTGEAGLGKSRLVYELQEKYRTTNTAAWANGRALSHADSAGYLVARDVFSQLLGLPHTATETETAAWLGAEIEDVLPGQSAELYPYLAKMLDLPLTEAAQQRLKYLSGGILNRRIMETARDFMIARCRHKPQILVWEDLHWADPSSLELLDTLLPITRRHPLLLVLIYRTPTKGSKIWHFQQMLSQGSAAASQLTLELPPLTPAESRELLANLLGATTLPETTQAMLISKAEGNPFYLEEVIRSLIDGRAVVRAANGTGWQITAALSDIKLPDTLQGVIMARIDQLDPQAKRVLQVAAVIGRKFPLEILADVLERVG